MDAFDMISEPVLFAQQWGEHSHRVYQSVELVPLLSEALLAQDEEKIKTLHEQISRITDEVADHAACAADHLGLMIR
jgi:hypothetical protein